MENLFKDPRTNWKYILILVILTVIVGGGILSYQYWWLPKQEVKPLEVKPPGEVITTVGLNLIRTKLAMINEDYDFIDSIVFSSDGKKVAYRVKKDEKYFVAVNEKISKPYDMILEGSLVFSPNNQRLAYVAQERGGIFVVLGDKEDKFNAKSYDEYYIAFSPDSKKVAYVANDIEKGLGRQFVVLNGEKSRIYGMYPVIDNRSLIFSPDSEQFAYIVQEAGTFRENLIVLNDQEIKNYDWVHGLIFNPATKQLVYVAWEKGKKKEFIVVDGQQGKIYEEVLFPTFSSDGKQFAYAAQEGWSEIWFEGDPEKYYTPIKFTVLNNQEGKKYNWVGKPVFSPDGSQLAYAAGEGYSIRATEVWEKFIVLNGQERKKYYIDLGDPVFSPNGKRLAYRANWKFIVLDGEEKKSHDRVWDPIFSPDSKYIAYGARDGNELWWIVEPVE